MSDDLGGMPFAPEMHAFQAEIRCYQGFVPCGNLQDGAVIPNAYYDPAPSGDLRPDARDQ